MVDLLTDDDLGRGREGPSSHAGYRRAFDEIAADGGHELLVAEIDWSLASFKSA